MTYGKGFGKLGGLMQSWKLMEIYLILREHLMEFFFSSKGYVYMVTLN